MIRRPPRSTRTDTLFPYTTLFRSQAITARICRAFTQRYAAPRNPVILSPSLFCRLQAALPAGRAEAAPDLGADRPCRLGRLANQARQPGDEGGIGPSRPHPPVGGRPVPRPPLAVPPTEPPTVR